MTDKKKDTEAPAAKPKKDQAAGIRVTAKTDGFRRCGVAHSAEGTLHALDAFTPKQWKAMNEEPELVVSPVADGFDQWLDQEIARDGDTK